MNVVGRQILVRLGQSVLPVLVGSAVLMFAGNAAIAETRVALVIGNGDYRNTSKLANPRNDATDVAAALKRIGFSTIVGIDLDKAGMDDAEIRFARAARDADVAMIYYSGHAIQYAATNYLLPVDAQIKDSADLRRLAKVDDLVSDLQQAKDLRILVLDSCRDNPLADELKRLLGQRSAAVERGLARIGNSQGMITAYSTMAGQTADDGHGRNSPYTAAFLKQIETPQEISTVFKKVSREVFESTDRKQVPELSVSLFGDFYLGGRPDPSGSPVTSKEPGSFAPENAVRTYKMTNGSMYPTFSPGEALSLFTYRNAADVKRGDVVVFKLKDGDTAVLKRIVGLPGDLVQMKQGQLYLNGPAVARRQLPDLVYQGGDKHGPCEDQKSIRQWQETLPNGVSFNTLDCVDTGFYDNTNAYQVPPGKFFVLGDNRDNSTDSRVQSAVGYIAGEDIVGWVEKRKNLPEARN